MIASKTYRIAAFAVLPFLLPACSAIEGNLSQSKSPEVPSDTTIGELRVGADGTRSIEQSWVKKKEEGLWEMYVEGGPYQRGKRIGKLTKPLLAEQERIFIERIREMIPSESYLNFLKYFVSLFTMGLDKEVSEEQLLEIRGVSEAASSKYDVIGPAFYRMLNYHAAHDIGHALQNMELVSNPIVGCSSFSVNGKASEDDELLVGRNFDFSMGDAFARNKIAAFYRPDSGHPFMMVTWPGMTGAVSGMNKEGLSVTLNAARSGIPKRVGTPVSLIGREILQHASTIQEAYEIAASKRSFVAETFLIASAKEGETAVIEKTPRKMNLYRPNEDRTVVTNHFQSKAFQKRELTREHKKRNPTTERYQRLDELLEEHAPLDPRSAAEVLRDPHGIGGKPIGLGNEMALNQFLAHHSIIFRPEKKQVWLSTAPYQLGEYVAYDLDSVFAEGREGRTEIGMEGVRIPPSELLDSGTYERFERFKKLRSKLIRTIKDERSGLPDEGLIRNFVESNPEYFEVHMLLGDLYRRKKDYEKAIESYSTALTKEIPRRAQREHIKEGLQKALRKSE